MELSPYLSIGRVGSITAFSPSDIAGLRCWLKPDVGVLAPGGSAAVNNDPVDTWQDQSGSNRDLIQAVSSKRPTLKTNQINGYPAILGDGVDDLLSTASNIGITGNAAFTVFAVLKPVSTSVDSIYYGFGNGGTALGAVGLYNLTSLFNVPFAGAQNYNSDIGPASGFQLISLKKSAGAIDSTTTLRKNGVTSGGSHSSASTPNILNGVLNLFAWVSAFYANANIYISEFILYPSALTTKNLTSVETYLNAKYALF